MKAAKPLIKVEGMEYCYCIHCRRLKESADLVMTIKGLKCLECGNFDFEEPGWVNCPYQKLTAVKCPRAGKGITNNDSGLDCADRCYFRA